MADKNQSFTKQKDLVEIYRQALAHGFSLDEVDLKIRRHLKRLAVTEKIEQSRQKNRAKEVKRRLPLAVRALAVMVPLVFIGAGVYLLGNVVVPIFGYYVTNSVEAITQPKLIAPIPETEVLDVTPLMISTSVEDEAKEAEVETKVVDSIELDFTNLANWFGAGQVPNFTADQAPISKYTLDIPKLKIHNAKVKVGGTDLSKSLLAYPGTALPGQHGSPVIFGHSVLRRFYNPSEKNPRRYMSIFSTIMTLEPGDKIYVTADGVKYTYVVKDKKEVKPEDVYILTQKYDDKKLKLVTCTPEGTTLRRGVVEAELAE